MSNQLPTEPGPYLYKPDGDDEWVAIQISDGGVILLAWGMWHNGVPAETLKKGQWAKAFLPDRGKHRYVTSRANGEEIYIGSKVKCSAAANELNDNPMFESGYKCESVTIFRNEVEQ